jgi:preprotein translocase subunit SecD
LKPLAILLLLTAIPARADSVAVLQIEAGADRLGIAAEQITSVRITSPLLLPAIEVALTPEMRAPVAKLTAAHVGEELVISICGTVLMRPVLRDPITGGTFMLTAEDGDDAHRLARLLQSKDCPH